MKYYVGVTDDSWFRSLAERKPDEVNFWRPGGSTSFRAIAPGAPILFKLHSPNNFIVGGGFFVRYAPLPLSIAWDAFGEKNGVEDFAAFQEKIRRYRRGDPSPDPVIGCIVLGSPLFFERERWVPIPTDWHPNLVQGKSYDSAEPIGRALWSEVQARLREQAFLPGQQLALDEPLVVEARYGAEYLTRPRLGQGAFRVVVTEAYQRRCAVTSERTLPILQAAHIQPYGQGGPHDVVNGLLLRADLHILFDRGYVTVSDDLHLEVSPRIKKDYGNGRDYYALHGRSLSVPRNQQERPAAEFLHWHQDHVYVA